MTQAMSFSKRAWAYAIVAVFLFCLDRVTKYLALHWCVHPLMFNAYVSCHVVQNRGVSWGLFHAETTGWFLVVSAMVVVITLVLIRYTAQQFALGVGILGEVLVLTGSFSNIIDRVYYHGVVDFIELSYRGWQWPSFNVADVCIVMGVLCMVVTFSRQ